MQIRQWNIGGDHVLFGFDKDDAKVIEQDIWNKYGIKAMELCQ